MKNKDEVIKLLKITPIVQIACQKAGISRATYYRWRQKSDDFKKKTNIALKKGRGFINELAESQLISAIKDKNMTAIIYWLKNNHPNYSERKLFLSSKEIRELVKTITSPDSLEDNFEKLAQKVVEGKIPKSFISSLISLLNTSIKAQNSYDKNKKIELINKVKNLENNL